MGVSDKLLFNESDFPEKYRDWLGQFSLSPRSVRVYFVVVRKFHNKYDVVTEVNVNSFLKKNPRAYSHAGLKHMLKSLGLHKDIELQRVKRPARQIHIVPERSELKEILDGLRIKNPDVKWTLLMLYHTGKRVREVLDMRFDNIDFERARITFMTKGDVPDYALVPKDFLANLKKYLVDVKGVYGNERCFFTYSKDTDSAYRLLRYHLERVPGENKRLIMRTHNFRRAVINEILDSGDLLTAKETVGHRSERSTLAYVSARTRKKRKEDGFKILHEAKEDEQT